jgi:hypothetical protein
MLTGESLEAVFCIEIEPVALQTERALSRDKRNRVVRPRPISKLGVQRSEPQESTPPCPCALF